MNFLKLAATAVLSATALVAPVEANTLTPGQRTLLYELERSGVTVESGTCQNKMLYGWFENDTRKIAICLNNHEEGEDPWQTLRHEAVHAAQHCVNPSMSFTVSTSSYILRHGNQDDWEFIQSVYPREAWAIELEAFTLMRYSNSQIANVVRGACNS